MINRWENKDAMIRDHYFLGLVTNDPYSQVFDFSDSISLAQETIRQHENEEAPFRSSNIVTNPPPGLEFPSDREKYIAQNAESE